MTKKEVENLKKLHEMLLEVKESLYDKTVLCTDEDGGYTHNAMRVNFMLADIIEGVYRSWYNEKLEIKDFGEY